jgi:hypothetical protein
LEAKHSARQVGARLVFVYLPEYERFNPATFSAPWSASRIKPDIVDLVSSLGIDLIDIEDAFLDVEDPLDLFPFRMQGHYNKRGYAVVANKIKEYLDESPEKKNWSE